MSICEVYKIFKCFWNRWSLLNIFLAIYQFFVMPSVLCSEQQMNSMKIRLYSTKLSFKFQYTLLKLLTTPHPTVHCNRATRNTSVFTFSTLTANDELHTHTTRQNRDAEVRDTRRRGATDRRLSTTAAATTGDAGWMPHTDVVVFAVLADALQTTLHYTAKRRTHTLFFHELFDGAATTARIASRESE